MTVLLGYFLIGALGGVAASAIIGLILTNLLVARWGKADRSIEELR
jgi:hypothetical protein